MDNHPSRLGDCGHLAYVRAELVSILFCPVNEVQSPNSEIDSYLLYREHGRILAADASHIAADDAFPAALQLDELTYRPVEGEDTFFFWDELRDSAKRTAGFTFLMPDSPTLANSDLLLNSSNVYFNDGDVRVFLEDCENSEWECVQGFGSEVYQCQKSPSDCVLLMHNWSRNPEGFMLHVGPNGKSFTIAQ